MGKLDTLLRCAYQFWNHSICSYHYHDMQKIQAMVHSLLAEMLMHLSLYSFMVFKPFNYHLNGCKSYW